MSGTGVISNQILFEQELKAAGLPRLAVAALLGRAAVESGFRSNALNKDDPNGGSFGILQLNGKRRTDFINFAKENGADPEDPRVQARFAVAEIKGEIGTEKNNGARLINASSPAEAAEAVMHFTRPAGFTKKNPRGGLGFQKTLTNTIDYITATNDPNSRDTSPFLRGDLFGIKQVPANGANDSALAQDAVVNKKAKDAATGPISGTPLDKFFIGLTEIVNRADNLPKDVAPDEVDIGTNLLNRQAPSISNFLRSLPGVGLQSIRR